MRNIHFFVHGFGIVFSILAFFASFFLPLIGMPLPASVDPTLFGLAVSLVFYLGTARFAQMIELHQKTDDLQIGINNKIREEFMEFQNHFDSEMRHLRNHVTELTDNTVVPRILDSIDGHPVRRHRKDMESSLSFGQIRIKEAIRRNLLNRQSLRLVHLEYNEWTHIYDFSVIHSILYRHAFSGSLRRKSNNIVRDYTVSWNADRGFGDYSYDRYFRTVINQRDGEKNCTTTIQFLIFVDFDGLSKGAPGQFSAEDAAKQLERSIYDILRIYATRYFSDRPVDQMSPAEIYNHASKNLHFFSVRILNLYAFSDIPDLNIELIDQPFNVYADLCVSKSTIRNIQGDPPIPHLEVSVDPQMVDEYSRDLPLLTGPG